MCALRYCVEVRDAKSDDTKCLTINPYQNKVREKERELGGGEDTLRVFF